jgi:hypothetical protein
MARRLGFIIATIRAKDSTIKNDEWKNVYRERMQRLETNHRLTYT